MLVYVVCSEVPWDSYHHVELVTLDKTEAEEKIKQFNSNHESGCQTQRDTESDWDECFCRRLHMHELPLNGLPDRQPSKTAGQKPLDKPAEVC